MGTPKVSTFEDLKRRLNKNPEFRKVHRLNAPYYNLIKEIIRRRKKLGLTQKELADKAGTHQANVSRIESGELDVRLGTITQLAEAMESRVCVWLEPFDDGEDDDNYMKLFNVPTAKQTSSPVYEESADISYETI